MSKRRITLSLDEDIVEALEAWGERSLSAAANAALRDAVAKEAHHRVLLEWLDELDEEWGKPTPDELAEADAVLDELERGDHAPRSAA
jgi:Arc/MetJ-type ribon-helix-helix transcriptional regulator